jgi:hypothetical protein
MLGIAVSVKLLVLAKRMVSLARDEIKPPAGTRGFI